MTDVRHVFQLKESATEIYASVKEYYAKYIKMRALGREYNKMFTDAGYAGVQAEFQTDYGGKTHRLLGFRLPVDLESETSIEKFPEIRHENLNGLNKKRFQPLKKNKFNKEKTSNFEDLTVSYDPILQAVYNSTFPFKEVIVNGETEWYIKSLSYSFENEKFVIDVLEEDINDHIRNNYDYIGEKVA